MSAPLLHPRANSQRAPRANLLAVGIDHRSASIELRERVALSRADSESMLQRLVARPEVEEAFLLSTCNRTEVHVLPREPEGAYRAAMDLVFGRVPEIERDGRFWVLRERAAARHLLAVAAGLESMVLGEPEILGQVRRAAELSEQVGSSGTILRRLLRDAVATGARARSETAIGAGAVSLGYAVVELARHIFVALDNRSCLVLGGGDMATMAGRALTERGVTDLRFAMRSTNRHAALREEFPGAKLADFDQRYAELAGCDLLVTATGADESVVDKGEVKQVMRTRRSRPLLIVDLGLPRNVAPDVRDLPNVFVHDLDSLQHLIGRNLAQRREQVPAVEAIVEQDLVRFETWWQGLAAEPVIAELQRRAERIRSDEVDRARDRFPTELHEDLDRLTRALVRKILHHPSTRLRDGGDRGAVHLDVARELFQLGEDDER